MKKFAACFHLLIAVLSLAPALSQAVCINGHPSIQEEIAGSHAILIATVVAAHDAKDDPADPEGVTSTIYTVKVREILAGLAPSNVRLVSENSSGRFPMDIGVTYLAFVLKNRDTFQVNSCGNSGALPQVNGVIRQVRSALRKTA